MRLRVVIRNLVIIIILLVAGAEFTQLISGHTRFTSLVANVLFQSNFHEVAHGRFYRSAEMPSSELEDTIKKYGIKTVVDLRFGRGEGDAESRSSQESSAVEALHANYVRFPLRGSRVPPKQVLRDLLKQLRESPEPILVHCSSGTHRSGIASAFWLLDQKLESVDDASNQLSPKFGFFRWERDLKSMFQGHPTIDGALWQFEEEHKRTGISFQDWLAKD